MIEIFAVTAVVGIGATVLIDLWSLVLKAAFRAQPLDFRLVGRWIGHMRHGKFAHGPIKAAQAVRGELALGWLTHYATGVLFAALLVGLAGPAWLERPTPGPALMFGLLTVAAPFFVMQPALGMGVAASKAPRPAVARIRSLSTHLVFGAGLYFTAWVLAELTS